MSILYWLHDECLKQPEGFKAGDRLVYIWDAGYFNDQAWSFKRLVFLYECLCSLGCEIYQAEDINALRQLIEQNDTSTMITWQAHDPILARRIQKAKQHHPSLQVLPQTSLVAMHIQPPVKRFFHYWKRVEKSLTGQHSQNARHRVK
jgi:hypothetical protein